MFSHSSLPILVFCASVDADEQSSETLFPKRFSFELVLFLMEVSSLSSSGTDTLPLPLSSS